MPTDFFGRVMVVFNRYGMSMLQGAGVSLKIALVGTLVGCIIGFAVGIVQTIPSERGDNPVTVSYTHLDVYKRQVFSGHDRGCVPVMPQYPGADADAGGYY